MIYHTWKKYEIDYICENYNSLGLKLLHENLKQIFDVNVSIASLSNKCRTLGYKTTNRVQRGYLPWSDEDINFLNNNKDSMSIKDISLHLNRTENSITSQISRLQLNKNKLVVNVWSDYEKEYLLKNYKKMPTKDISLHLNRTVVSIVSYANRKLPTITRTNEKSIKIKDCGIDCLLSEYGDIE